MILQVKKLKRLLFMKLIKLGNKLKLIKPDSCYYMGGVNVLPPPLTLEEEKELLQKLEYDDNIKTILIERNLRLVVYISRKFENTGIDMEDLISIGTIGLIKAVNTFNLDKNIKLATYASRCIENEILMHFRNDKKNSKNVSLDESIGFDKEGNEITIVDVLKTSNPDYIDSINTKDNIVKLNKYINVLSDREKKIIIKRYGLYGEKEITQKKVADELNISRSYVSRIEKRALTKLLREFIRNNHR